MLDTTVTANDQWTDALSLSKGDCVSISVKGTFVGTISVRRWLEEYGETPSTDNIGIVQNYTAPIEAVDISGGNYYYQIGSTAWTSGVAYIHIQ